MYAYHHFCVYTGTLTVIITGMFSRTTKKRPRVYLGVRLPTPVRFTGNRLHTQKGKNMLNNTVQATATPTATVNTPPVPATATATPPATPPATATATATPTLKAKARARGAVIRKTRAAVIHAGANTGRPGPRVVTATLPVRYVKVVFRAGGKVVYTSRAYRSGNILSKIVAFARLQAKGAAAGATATCYAAALTGGAFKVTKA